MAKAAQLKTYAINLGDKAPGFQLPASGGKKLGLKGFKGDYLVLYFYPKDNTPGCTLEGQGFKKLYSKFQNLGAEIYGISKDSVEIHEKFSDKCGFPFALLSDVDGSICAKFDVIQMKNMYGKKFEGIERSTFVIDAKGKLVGVWRKVKVDGHAAAVLKLIQEQNAEG